MQGGEWISSSSWHQDSSNLKNDKECLSVSECWVYIKIDMSAQVCIAERRFEHIKHGSAF